MFTMRDITDLSIADSAPLFREKLPFGRNGCTIAFEFYAVARQLSETARLLIDYILERRGKPKSVADCAWALRTTERKVKAALVELAEPRFDILRVGPLDPLKVVLAPDLFPRRTVGQQRLAVETWNALGPEPGGEKALAAAA